MEVVNQATNTPYNQVVSLVADAMVNQDFEFLTDSQGNLEAIHIFESSDRTLRIEMDDHLFLDVYDIVKGNTAIPQDSLRLIDSVVLQLEKAA